MAEVPRFTKKQIAADRSVTTRTVDRWVSRGWLRAPVKMGQHMQSRVRYSAEAVAELDERLAMLGEQTPAIGAATRI